MKNWFRLRMLNWARRIVEKEGLTCADIRSIGGTNYIVDKNNTFFVIGKEGKQVKESTPEKVHNLRLIK